MSADNAASIARFRELLQIPTVSHADEGLIDWEPFDRLLDAVVRLYPALHAVLEREVVDGHSLLYRWPGARGGADPLVLMAHLDVVPVVEQEWDLPPFAAEIAGEGADAAIHARGAIDDKGALVAILEAVEALVADGFSPQHDVYLAFGHNEETAGGGARAIVALLRERGVEPGLVLDEGGAVVEGVVPGISVPTAMVGVAERGVMTLRLTAREGGGHASTPPAFPATARLARAIDRIHRHPFPARIAPPVRALFATLAPHAAQPLRTVFANLGLLAPVVARVFPRLGPEMNAMVRTTAVATELSGAPGENVLATTARAAVNVRLLTGDTVASATARIRRVVADPHVEVEVRHGSDPSPVSPWRGRPWRRIATAVRETLGEEVVTTPYIQLGASDSRWFTAISAHVYRFTPFHLTRAERDALHSHNERIRVASWLAGIRFYRALIAAS
ncbi:M20/M25/M40 family metallo-hydrolase [Microbacterium hominis]|uniref:M20/M25/M40 family metallo-hydrolase n=1 Tax=Microbacterium TaxID=33882 RepID=UPI00168B4399|nr:MULTISPECIES: M20/M25/M40 family metallo-hydrolase [Microbacterium]QOC25043.1 M20/M25/M40 family metallo-hydrolase [Microbacterium hominis]QOC29089.1 M20/M25/M40 family metallo-hydrolase [Microbacterium hominis]QYF98696.1 M20/M25/M40 family metallo-hydrolase [Microbacterium sp. PAMC21962]